MTDEYRPLPREGSIAESMIGMCMGVDHVADRLCRNSADRGKQPAPLAHAAASVDHGDRLIPDYEADIRNPAFILGCHQLIDAEMNENAFGYFGDLKGAVGGLGVGQRNQSKQKRDRDGEPVRGLADTIAEATSPTAFTPATSIRMTANHEAAGRCKCRCAGHTH